MEVKFENGFGDASFGSSGNRMSGARGRRRRRGE